MAHSSYLWYLWLLCELLSGWNTHSCRHVLQTPASSFCGHLTNLSSILTLLSVLFSSPPALEKNTCLTLHPLHQPVAESGCLPSDAAQVKYRGFSFKRVSRLTNMFWSGKSHRIDQYKTQNYCRNCMSQWLWFQMCSFPYYTVIN